MICLSVMYASGPGNTFDFEYYEQTHGALVKDLLTKEGLTRLEIDRGLASLAVDSEPPYACIGRLYFGCMAEFEHALATHGAELQADIPNFTNITPVFQISETV